MEENIIHSLLASQSLMTQQNPLSVNSGMSQVPVSFFVEKELNFELLKQAVDIEIERNDGIRIKFIKIGKEYRQTFLPPFKYSDIMGEIETFDFTGKTEKEQEKCLKALSGKSLNLLKGEDFRIAFIKSFDGKYGFFFSASHLVCDMYGLNVTVGDIIGIYRHLSYGEPMPKPLGSFEKSVEQEEKISREKIEEDINNFYGYYDKLGPPKSFSGIIDKRLSHKKRESKFYGNKALNIVGNIFNSSSDTSSFDISPEMRKRWYGFCKSERFTVNTLVSFGIIAYLAKINESNDVIFMNVCNRRFSQMKKCSGLFFKAFNFRIIPEDTDTVCEILRKYTVAMFHFYRHLSMSTTEIGLYPKYGIFYANYYGSMSYSFFEMACNAPIDWNYFVKPISQGHTFHPEYLYVMSDSFKNTLSFNFEYQKRYTNKIQIKAQFNGICDAINAAVDNPSLTFKQIKDLIQ